MKRIFTIFIFVFALGIANTTTNVETKKLNLDKNVIIQNFNVANKAITSSKKNKTLTSINTVNGSNSIVLPKTGSTTFFTFLTLLFITTATSGIIIYREFNKR